MVKGLNTTWISNGLRIRLIASERPPMYGSVTEVLGLTSSADGLGLGGQECLCMKPEVYPFSFNAVATSFSSCACSTPEDDKASALVISVLSTATLGRYWFVWAAFLYTEVGTVPSTPLTSWMSRKASVLLPPKNVTPKEMQALKDLAVV